MNKRQLRAGLLLSALLVVFYLLPAALLLWLVCGCYDLARNRPITGLLVKDYVTGNGVGTWMLSPLNVLFDLICLPFWNRGIYQLSELPAAQQAEINDVIDVARREDFETALAAKMQGIERGMIFFKWYGKNVENSFFVEEYHRDYRYIRTIGVSIFNPGSSGTRHFGPLRMMLRVLFNINELQTRDAYIDVGGHRHHWCENPLFIFDDTLQHHSFNHSQQARYCLFVDVLRPSLLSRVLDFSVNVVRLLFLRINAIFYKSWAKLN